MSNINNGKTETHNFVNGWDIKGNYVLVCPKEFAHLIGKQRAEKNMSVDCTEPVTLARCRRLIDQASEMWGTPLRQITIHDSEYTVTPGNECNDFPERCIRNNEFQYDRRTDTLVISRQGKIVYINEGGTITRGNDAAVAWADSLDV